MKVIVLAAGQGTRLRPYTNDRPKCMVELGGKPLLYHQLAVFRELGIASDNIALVGGYLKERLDAPGVHLFINERFAETNMVNTLFCAESFMQPDEDLLICYGDIVFEIQVMKTLLNTEGELVVAADRQWKRLWSLRMDEPLRDAESFKMNGGRIEEIGKTPSCYDEIQAQYIGLIRIRADRVQAFMDFYHALSPELYYDGKDIANMYMTSLIQELIEARWNVRPALVDNGWLEVDSASELEIYEQLYRNGQLDSFMKLTHHSYV